MKLQDVKLGGGGDYLWEIPADQETKLRILSTDFEYMGKHYDESKKKYFTCIGEKKGCPLCGVSNKTERYLGYIYDGSKVVLAGLPYSVLQGLKEIYEKEPESFVNDVPQFAISVFRSGTGKDTKYVVTKDIADDTNFDLSSYQDPKEYIEAQKELTKKEYNINDGEEATITLDTPPF